MKQIKGIRRKSSANNAFSKALVFRMLKVTSLAEKDET